MSVEDETGRDLSQPERGGQDVAEITARRYSRGGLIASGVMAVVTVVTIASNGNTPYQIIGYITAVAALVVRSFRPPMRWWHGVVVWLGGLIAGMSTSLLEYAGRAPQISIPLFVLFLGLGALILWLGFKKPRPKQP
jgi:hypothetical protein